MTSICLPERNPAADEGGSAMGLARLMRMAFEGFDLKPIAARLIARASADECDADALMDLSTTLQLQGLRELGLATQAQALQIKRLYELPARRPATIRLLAVMAAGDLMANAPLPFLIEDSDISLSMLYMLPGEPFPVDLPPHDVAFIAVSESDATRALLTQLAQSILAWGKPVINHPGRIVTTSRSRAYALLEDVPGIHMPASVRSSRARLQQLSTRRCDLGELLREGTFPLIIRPVDSHAGHGLAKVDDAAEVATYLEATVGDEFFISRFIDYRGQDGLFRKYRVVLIDGVAFAGHMGVSAHWMIHYLNAGMTDSAQKRAEEEAFMQRFEVDFAKRHGAALRTISERFGLEYLVIDCGETSTGELLVFEVDPGAVVHAMDPVDLFAYKRASMEKVFTAFRTMLVRLGQTR